MPRAPYRAATSRRPVNHAGIQLHYAIFVRQTAVAHARFARIELGNIHSGNNRIVQVAAGHDDF